MSASPRLPGRPSPSLWARLLEPLATLAWGLLIAWSGIVAILWAFDVRGAEVQARITHPELDAALRWVLDAADLIWISLAAGNVYFCLVAAQGLSTARRWALVIIGGAAAAAAILVWIGGPLGPVRYTDRLGPKLGPVPCALPLLWIVVVLGGRALLLRLLPRASHGQIALGVGLLAALTNLTLEPVAWTQRLWWTWRASAESPAPALFPLPSAAAWLILGAALAYALREQRVVRSAAPSLKPALVLGMLHAMLLSAHLGRAFGW